MIERSVNLETAIHVAGVSVKIGSRILQRCCVCGEKLADTADQSLLTFWQEGDLVRNNKGFLQSTGRNLLALKKLPNSFCLDMVEM